MTLPVEFTVDGMRITAHLVMELLAYTIGLRYYAILRRRQGDVIGDEQRIWVFMGGLFGAAIGAKLLGVLEHPQLIAMSRQSLVYLLAAKTIVGGLIGGTIGVEIAKLLTGIRQSTGDLYTFPLILGIMIGRVGCFLAGAQDSTWGNPTDLFVGIDGGDGVPRHPAPLYEIGFLLALWIVLAALNRRVDFKPGSLFKLFMVSYFGWRFVIEFIKPVETVGPLGLSAIQLACLAGLAWYYRVIFKFRELRQESQGSAPV